MRSGNAGAGLLPRIVHGTRSHPDQKDQFPPPGGEFAHGSRQHLHRETSSIWRIIPAGAQSNFVGLNCPATPSTAYASLSRALHPQLRKSPVKQEPPTIGNSANFSPPRLAEHQVNPSTSIGLARGWVALSAGQSLHFLVPPGDRSVTRNFRKKPPVRCNSATSRSAIWVYKNQIF